MQMQRTNVVDGGKCKCTPPPKPMLLFQMPHSRRSGAGFFHDRYSDSGIPDVTSYTYQTVASPTLGLPAGIQGPTGIQNAPRVLITAFDATKRIQFNADYTHRFEGIGRHTVKGGASYQHLRNDINSLYPGGYVDIFWGIPAILPGQAPDQGHLRVLHRQ